MNDIHSIPLFRGADPEVLDSVCSDYHWKHIDYGKGEIIALQGDPCRYLFLLDEGCVYARMVSDEGREFTLDMLYAPEVLASSFVFSTERIYPVTIIAGSACGLWAVGRDSIGRLVREDSAVGLLEKIGVGCKGQVLDPTLLLDKDDWGGFIKSRRKGGYILAYQLNNAKVSDCARQLSIESGLPLVRVTPYFHQVVEGGKMVLLPSVGDFLSCIRDCSYLVTDSFHGTAFAINFNKQFMAVLPEGSTNTRNLSLLKLFGLERRAVSGTAIGGLAEGSIDYSLVNEMLEEQRRISIAALNNMLK